MAAAVDEKVAVVSAAKLPMAKSGHLAKAVDAAKDASKVARAKQSPHGVSALNAASAQNAVSGLRVKAVAMADLKPVVKTVAKLAPMRALRPEPMRCQSSTPMAPKCAKNVPRVRVAVSVAVKVAENAAKGANVAKPMQPPLN